MFDIKINIGGKQVKLDDSSAVETALYQAAHKVIEQQIRDLLSSVRDPETGEFAVISVEGSSLDDMRIKVEGSEAVVGLVLERTRELGMNETHVISTQSAGHKPIFAFLSYATADAELARDIAHKLSANGIDNFLAEWDIRSGDSIPEKINEALDRTSHFLILLTPRSQGRAWVKAEMDAGLTSRLDGKSQFIALRSGISVNELPPLIRPWHIGENRSI